MEEKLNEVNQLLNLLNYKAKNLKKANVKNIIFSLKNIENHYVTCNLGDVFYCYKRYNGKPKNDEDVYNFCSCSNLHRSLHDNDNNKRIKIDSFTEESLTSFLLHLKTISESKLK